MKIAILHCRRSSNVCTGAACFRAFNACEKGFQQYAGQSPTLAAFFDCGGCGIDRNTDAGMIEKMEALKRIGVEKIHLGICIRDNCPDLPNILAMLKQYEIPYEFGTH